MCLSVPVLMWNGLRIRMPLLLCQSGIFVAFVAHILAECEWDDPAVMTPKAHTGWQDYP